MRAVVHERYGDPDVLRLADVDRPRPEADEVLVRVRATTVNRTDTGFRKGKPFIVRLFSGLVRPKLQVLGTEFAGEVTEVGAAVTEFAVGDEVFGVNADRFGAHAEFVCVREDAPVAAKPTGMTFEEAAAILDGAVLALACLRGGDLRAGQRILIYGASGSIGTAAVQVAKHLGASVTAVCNADGLDLVRSLGADDVVDYTKTDFTRSGETYDVVFDSVGKTSFRRCRRLLPRRGIYVETDLGFLAQNPPLAIATWVTSRFGGRRVTMPLPKYTKQTVRFIKELVEAGEYRAVIDRTYPLEEIVDATRYVETERKIGNVVVTVGSDSTPRSTG